MEKTITFIAEHKKREYEQLNEDIKAEQNIPQEQPDMSLDPDPNPVE